MALFLLGFALTSLCSLDSYLLYNNKKYKGKREAAAWRSSLANYQTDNAWSQLITNEKLEIPEIEKDDWSYPWYMIKHGVDQFENTFGEPITAADTVKLIHNSKCYSYLEENANEENEWHTRLPFAEASLSKDTLYLKIYDSSASNGEVLEIILLNGQFKTDYETGYVFPYKAIEFQMDNQYLEVNLEAPFRKGEILKGKLKCEFTESIIFDNNYLNQKVKYFKGTFETKIK